MQHLEPNKEAMHDDFIKKDTRKYTEAVLNSQPLVSSEMTAFYHVLASENVRTELAVQARKANCPPSWWIAGS